MKIETAISHAADMLPDGWKIRLDLLGESLQIIVIRPDASEVCMDDGELDEIEQVRAGIRLAYDEVAAEGLSV